MQSHFRRAAPFLLLGLVTSIGVAWAACLWQRPYYGGLWVEVISGRPRAAATQQAWSHEQVLLCEAMPREGPPTDFITDVRTVDLPRSLRWSRFDFALTNHEILRAGWPLRCLESERRSATQSLYRWDVGQRFWSVRLRAPRWKNLGPAALDGTVPLRPLPLGLIINTLFFASLWALPYVAFFTLTLAARRRSRISRGLCPACAYDLRGSQSAKCPECGRACQTAP